VERIAKLAGAIAAKIGADPKKAERAARLAKADLTTGVVGEFPELQGVMGRYYALHDKEDAEIADAVRDHYKPVGPSDAVPTAKISISVALADKLDMLAGFFAIDQKPTGSGDPFALRRAALGVVRIILDNKVRLHLPRILMRQARFVMADTIKTVKASSNIAPALLEQLGEDSPLRKIWSKTDKTTALLIESSLEDVAPQQWEWDSAKDILNFISDRLKVVLRDQGISHDRIDSIWALAVETDLVRLVGRVEALQAFLKTDDGTNLLAGYKRAANILKAEEKKDGPYASDVTESLLTAPAEKSLYIALSAAKTGIAPALEKEDFAAAMRQMAALRGPVDAFFDGVKVTDENPELRENRLTLLASLRAALHQVADFSKIEG
jgi:glycyl-tRNA synthetase beta chain